MIWLVLSGEETTHLHILNLISGEMSSIEVKGYYDRLEQLSLHEISMKALKDDGKLHRLKVQLSYNN
jgi:hypothetical protein